MHINKNVKPTHHSLHRLGVLEITLLVETSNSELHADMYMLTPYTPTMPIVWIHHRLMSIIRAV